MSEINFTLEEIERRKAILKFRQEQGLGLKAVNRQHLLEVLQDPKLQAQTASIVFDHQLLEITNSFWQSINSPMRTNAIMSYRFDNFINAVEIAKGRLGIKAVCFIQEGFNPPEVLVDLYTDTKTRTGIESCINAMGELVFLDPEINQAWPQGIRRLLQATVLAHYTAIVCPQIQSDDDNQAAEIKAENVQEPEEKPRGRKRRIRFRRAHLRKLPEGQYASARALALAITTGKFTEKDMDRLIQEGRRRTFVKEVFRPSGEEAPQIEPRRLYGKISPIKFLNAYLSLVNAY